MKFPFFNRFSEDNNPDWTITRDSIPLSTLARWYIYDMGIDEPNKFGEKTFNLTPISAEGNEKELEDSVDRMQDIIQITSFLGLMAELNAKSIASVQKAEMLKHGMSEEDIDTGFIETTEFYKQVGMAALVSSYSAAAKLGLIDISGTFTDVEEMDDK